MSGKLSGGPRELGNVERCDDPNRTIRSEELHACTALDHTCSEVDNRKTERISIYPDRLDSSRRIVRDTAELTLCSNAYLGTLVYRDAQEYRYRDVLELYEKMMLEYESMADGWVDHFKNIQQTIDAALGIRQNMRDEEVREVLGRVGCIGLFGCGYKPTREMSKKLTKALAKGYAKVVLVDFSEEALQSSIRFLKRAGIDVESAYQMDLTLGAVGTLNSYSSELYAKLGGKFRGDLMKADSYFQLLEAAVDQLIDGYRVTGQMPGSFKGYIMKGKDRPGLAVSSMVGAATFLTVYYKLRQIVEESGLADNDKAKLHERIARMHAKFNAFTIQLIAGQMMDFSKEGGAGVMIAEINKIDLGLGIDPHEQVMDPEVKQQRAETVRQLRAVLDNRITVEESENGDLLDNVTTEIRISRDGNTLDLMEDVLEDAPLVDGRYQVSAIRGEEWPWWDELPHGHKVRGVYFKPEKKGRYDVIDLLNLVEADLAKSGDAKKIAEALVASIIENYGEENLKDNVAIAWLDQLALREVEIDDDTMESHGQYAFLAASEILSLVPKEVLNQGWYSTQMHLQKDIKPNSKRWMDDNRTKKHVLCGYHFLWELAAEIKQLVSKK